MRKSETKGWRRAMDHGSFWTEAEAREALDECERSGESVAAFARRHGIVAKRLYWWRHELKKEGRGETAVAPLIPVTLGTADLRGVGSDVVVVTGDVRLELGNANQVSPEWVAELVRLVREGRE